LGGGFVGFRSYVVHHTRAKKKTKEKSLGQLSSIGFPPAE